MRDISLNLSLECETSYCGDMKNHSQRLIKDICFSNFKPRSNEDGIHIKGDQRKLAWKLRKVFNPLSPGVAGMWLTFQIMTLKKYSTKSFETFLGGTPILAPRSVVSPKLTTPALPSSVQFKLASSVELRLALILVITHHPPTGKVVNLLFVAV